jgi:hypothetical protein
MERTRVQALRELRSLLSEVLSTAASDEQVPEAFKNPRNWEFLITRTESRLSEAWKKRFEMKKEGAKKSNFGALELLADEETDQALASERFVSEVLQEQAEPLQDLEQQLAAMSGVAGDETRENPLGPGAWAAGLRSGVRDIECSPDDRDWLMEQIMPLLADRVAQFYQALSQQMTSAGYAAPARAGRPMAKALPPKPKAAGAEAPPPGGFNPETVEARTGPATPLMDEAGGGEFDGQNQFEHLLGLISAQRGGGGGGGGGGDGAGGGIAGNYFGAAPAGPKAKPWSQDQLMSVLANLQSQSGAIATAGGTAAGIRDAIGNAASALGLGGGVHAMPEQAQDTLALVSMLFEALLEGKSLDPLAQSQLSRLIVPYVRMAVLDRALFMKSMHPARRVLNLLVEALETGSADAPKHKPLRELALGMIEQIVTGFNDDISIFEPMETALEAEIETSRKRAELAEKRASEAHAARERREQARDQVAEFLSEVLYGKRMPNVLLEFVVGPWQHYQNTTLLREGEGGSQVIANQLLLRDLLRANETGAIEAPEKLEPGVARALENSGQTAEAARVFLAQLGTALKLGQQAAKIKAATPPGTEVKLPPMPAAAAPVVVEKEVLVKSAEAIVPAAPVADAFVAPAPAEIEAAALPEDLVAKYEAMPLGTWVDLVGDDGRAVPAKITFVSPISGKRILSNRRGLRVLCASVQELATMEAEGQIKPRHSDRAFDNALGAVGRRLEAQRKPEPAPA